MTLEAFLRKVVSIVEDAGVPYMLTGSLAVAYYARPRATRDVDLVIAVSLEEVEDLELPMVTPEDLIVAKLEWARKGDSERQLRDALAVLRQQGPELDRGHLERWVGELGLDHEWSLLLGETE